jgi:molybdate transport system substrate-binding protein
MTQSTIIGISSMATRQILTELAAQYRAATGATVAVEAIGGVDAAKRVRAGEVFDIVILAEDMIGKLAAEGHLVGGSQAAFARSAMAMAVPSGAKHPDIGSEAAIRAALTEARSIGYSTGPSGVHLLGVLKSWGVDPAAEPGRFVQAKPGIPVATLVARGEAAIGIQQLSEFLGEPGIEIVGLVPPPVQTVTTFAMGIGARSTRPEETRALIAFLTAPAAAAVKRQFGMEPT